MQKRLLVAVFVLAIVSILNTPICAKPCDEVRLGQNEAQHDYTVEPVLNQIRCTCYIQKGTTASGQKVRKGIVAGRREWIGRTCALYSISENGGVGEFIGYYEFLDTGAGIDTDHDGKGDSIINGDSIDVWQPTIEDAKDFIKTYGDFVYMQFTEGEG